MGMILGVAGLAAHLLKVVQRAAFGAFVVEGGTVVDSLLLVACMSLLSTVTTWPFGITTAWVKGSSVL